MWERYLDEVDAVIASAMGAEVLRQMKDAECPKGRNAEVRCVSDEVCLGSKEQTFLQAPQPAVRGWE